MNLFFEVRCNPPKSTAQAGSMIMHRKKPDGSTVPFVGKSQSSSAAKAQKSLMALFSEHAPETPLSGPVWCDITWTYPWRASESKKRMLAARQPCDKRPDIDNIQKMMLDCLTRCAFWKDDGQVFAIRVRKYWGQRPGIVVNMGEKT